MYTKYRKYKGRYLKQMSNAMLNITDNFLDNVTDIDNTARTVVTAEPTGPVEPTEGSNSIPYMDGSSEFRRADFIHTMKSYVDRVKITMEEDTRPLHLQEEQRLLLEKYVIDDEERVAIVGDIHGGLCNLRNFILRLKSSDFFTNDTDYILKPHHRIISLGDLVDRGPNSLEVVHLLFALKMRNYDTVHLINGNHEDAPLYNQYGFVSGNYREIQGIIKDSKDTLFVKPSERTEAVFFKPFAYLPAAVFMRYASKPKWIQFCHGGIDEDVLLELGEFLDEVGSTSCLVEARDGATHSGLKWSDFRDEYGCRPALGAMEDTDVKLGGRRNTEHKTYGGCGCDSSRGPGTYIYGRDCTDSYLKRMGIECIVRGHQDMVNGFMALPRNTLLPKKYPHTHFTACIYPVGNKGACSDQYEDKHTGEQNLTRHRVEWSNMEMCHVKGRGTATDAKRYQLCVPRDRCSVFAQLFEGGDGAHAVAYAFDSTDISVLTTATCQQARDNLVECFVLMKGSA